MAKRKSPKQRKEERQQEKRRGQQTIIIGFVVLFVILAAIIFALTSLPANAPIPEGIDRYDNYMQSTTDEGYAVLGNPNAPVEVREYSSFSCVGCMDFHTNVFPGLLPYVESGAIKFVFVPLQTGSVPNPEGAARTAICAGEQGQFWQMHDVLFSWHETFVNSAFQDSRIRTGVQNLGLDTGEFNSCFRSNATGAVLSSAIAEGVGSTPTIEVNGVQVSGDLASIEAAIANNIGGQTSFEPGIITDASAVETEEPVDEVEATEEAMEETEEPVDEAEATEEAMEATEEPVDEVEATEEAMEETEATEEAEATEESE